MPRVHKVSDLTQLPLTPPADPDVAAVLKAFGANRDMRKTRVLTHLAQRLGSWVRIDALETAAYSTPLPGRDPAVDEGGSVLMVLKGIDRWIETRRLPYSFERDEAKVAVRLSRVEAKADPRVTGYSLAKAIALVEWESSKLDGLRAGMLSIIDDQQKVLGWIACLLKGGEPDVEWIVEKTKGAAEPDPAPDGATEPRPTGQRSTVKNPVRFVWNYLDQNGDRPLTQAVKELTALGINKGTASVQLYAWRKARFGTTRREARS